MFVMVALLASCIHDSEDCSANYKIILFVKDKAYFNEDESQNRSSFKYYIPNIDYSFKKEDGGKYQITVQYMEIEDGVQFPAIQLNSIPVGLYKFVVWGNFSTSISEENGSILLHRNQQEGTDLYVASYPLKTTLGSEDSYSIGMERVKGKLSVELIDFPSSIVRVDQYVSSVYSGVTSEMKYLGETNVNKTFLDKTQREFQRLETCLAPTIWGKPSQLVLSFYEGNSETPLLKTTETELYINRNEITYLKVYYNVSDGKIEIWMLIDQQWKLVNQLEIESNY